MKNLGDHSARFGTIPVGTRVFAEGPFGVFTEEARTTDKALLIAGGIGITPVRALMERMGGDVIALYRVASADDIVFAGELDAIASQRGMRGRLRRRRPRCARGARPALTRATSPSSSPTSPSATSSSAGRSG